MSAWPPTISHTTGKDFRRCRLHYNGKEFCPTSTGKEFHLLVIHTTMDIIHDTTYWQEILPTTACPTAKGIRPAEVTYTAGKGFCLLIIYTTGKEFCPLISTGK